MQTSAIIAARACARLLGDSQNPTMHTETERFHIVSRTYALGDNFNANRTQSVFGRSETEKRVCALGDIYTPSRPNRSERSTR